MQKTISIPKNLGHTKQLAEEKAKEAEETAKTKVVEVKDDGVEEGRDLTQNILDEFFPKLKEHFQQLDKSMEVAILGNSLKMKDAAVILEVMGHVQEELAHKMKPEVVRVIKELGKVNRFKVEVEIKEELDQLNKVYYTDSDKFLRLKELHPALSEFQRKFGLETDF